MSFLSNICNTSNTNTYITMHLVTSGNFNSANNAIISNINVVGNNVTFYNTSIIMPSNSSIYITQAGSNTATVAISGVEYIA